MLSVFKTLPVLLLIVQFSCASQPLVEECLTGKYPPTDKAKVPTFVINLDLPAQHRWDEVMKYKGKTVVNLLNKFKAFLLEFGKGSQFLLNLVDKDLGPLADTFPAPFGDEMRGIANATGLPLGEVVLYNIFYEVFTVCTSIVAQDPTGKLFHARNLDFGLFMGWTPQNHTWMITEALKPSIMMLNWQKGGKTVYKSVTFAGYVGIITAIKPGVFTMSMDERFNIDGGFIGILKWILGDHDGQWMGFLTRNVMESATSYDQAKTALANTTMLAPAYFILGGTKAGQACIITRSREKAVDIWEISSSKDMWYLLETNYDHWKKPFFVDDRRTPGMKCMNKHGQKAGASFSGLYDVLSSRPVLNKLTTYTALMEVGSGALETYLQSCPDPCDPW